MQRITTSTRALNLHGTGKDGFKNGNLGTGDAPTNLNAEWFNGSQEELMNAIESVGMTPSALDNTQLLQALRIMTGGAGRVQAFARSTAPTGWLECAGAAVSRTTYAALFAAIGTTYGAGNGSTTFNLPDLRGEFIRGWDHSRGADAVRAFGSVQTDALQNITGSVSQVTGGGTGATGAFAVNGASMPQIAASTPTTTPSVTFDASRVARTDAETRPRNVAMLYCISYF
jgi:microcystin-dependent protein